jgi:hypothetical protein
MIVGAGLLGVMTLMAARGRFSTENHAPSSAAGSTGTSSTSSDLPVPASLPGGEARMSGPPSTWSRSGRTPDLRTLLDDRPHDDLGPSNPSHGDRLVQAPVVLFFMRALQHEADSLVVIAGLFWLAILIAPLADYFTRGWLRAGTLTLRGAAHVDAERMSASATSAADRTAPRAEPARSLKSYDGRAVRRRRPRRGGKDDRPHRAERRGKSTLPLIGLVRPDAGTVRFEDRDVRPRRPPRCACAWLRHPDGALPAPHRRRKRPSDGAPHRVGQGAASRVSGLAEFTQFPADGLDRYPVSLGRPAPEVGLSAPSPDPTCSFSTSRSARWIP